MHLYLLWRQCFRRIIKYKMLITQTQLIKLYFLLFMNNFSFESIRSIIILLIIKLNSFELILEVLFKIHIFIVLTVYVNRKQYSVRSKIKTRMNSIQRQPSEEL